MRKNYYDYNQTDKENEILDHIRPCSCVKTHMWAWQDVYVQKCVCVCECVCVHENI